MYYTNKRLNELMSGTPLLNTDTRFTGKFQTTTGFTYPTSGDPKLVNVVSVGRKL